MFMRRLGRSDLQVSALGMGCWAIGGPWTWLSPDGSRGPAGWGQVDDAEYGPLTPEQMQKIEAIYGR